MPSRDNDSTRWVRMRFKNSKVWVAADAGGRPLAAGGLARIRYRRDQDQEYRVRTEKLQPLDAPPADPPSGARPSPAPPPTEDERCVHIFTDGACSGNPGPAGIGVVLVLGSRRKEISEYIGIATNNIAELTAIRRGLASLKRRSLPVRVYTDSSYAKGVLSQGWNAKKNQELIAEIRREMQRFNDLRLVKVEGHCGVAENERADRLAVEAIAAALRGQ